MTLLDETILTMEQAASHPLFVQFHGKSIHRGSLHRWARYGVGPRNRRVFLEVAVIGRCMVTSEQALKRFFEAWGAAHRQDKVPVQPTEKWREKQRHRAYLESEGLIGRTTDVRG